MDAQVLARWQFGITTVYHYFFVPITLGITWLLAILQTLWVRSGNDQWLRLVKFFGKLFLINFAAGVVTGIVQEFQFGMNWSEYSRFVGDIFGAPLALEALIAFFLESTFVGLWIFGWNRLPKGLHLATIWLTALGSFISSIFILAANSWMQNPVGAVYNAATGRAELSDFLALITNPVFLATLPHTIGAAFMTAGALLLGVSGWWLAKKRRDAQPADSLDTSTWRKSARFSAWVLILASLVTFISGDFQGKVEAEYQPMKLAAAEGLLETQESAPFSVVAIITTEGSGQDKTYHKVFSLDVPGVLSILAKNDPNAKVQGIQDLRESYLQEGYATDNGTQNALQSQFADELKAMPVDPVPNVMVNYYSFRLMIGLGVLAFIIGIATLVQTRRDHLPKGGKFYAVLMACLPFMPLFANSFGWILTELGRQPWIVNGVLPTWTAASPGNGAGAMWLTMILYTLVYAVVAVIVLKLFIKTIKEGLPALVKVEKPTDDAPLSFAY
ncbi:MULTISPECIES: cytochrome ubiquinol oxidase subunit I [Propionibacterium]|jgi:cytochrome d ubiquinol oxidase subunit I|uniref:Cytochrome D ubiquinol oxidase, subunit 1 domain protein n=3 Tax=Propionibacterium freudenreichii TaxID=1744 RepID=A0A0A8PXS6_9ACTN|nr:cytochrome ubiquinol oxidase subunit I [Propionibacterium freudenreichii]MDN5961597.1 cytochrome ubiquinol oxidase subunit I [Propionibacterium sp.]AJQ89910.1 Cytochrome bd-type menaquinol oxidase subunit I [Propionibacterium freudenreichii subsp. freudenreichii]ARO12866.1 cytochrome ubiquinol oxidase subunit I [Propionibacterium freudenreichii]MCT2973045.1 cytochrome ubiquinol oxidase subunit I [Propionibacterium freudenreichii]MCT2979069.1 cytochrome ubiquinol oxidase subunit I [Propionib